MIKTLILAGVVLLFGFFIMYNNKFLRIVEKSAEKSGGLLHKLVGKRVIRLNATIDRASMVKKTGIVFRFNKYYDDIIINLGLRRDHVTSGGLLVFILSVSITSSLLISMFLSSVVMFPLLVMAVFYFVTVIFRFISLLKFEKKEAHIMDTEDLIAMDVKGGVYNAIVRYHKSFHPTMQPYFNEFIDNIKQKGYSFSDAMLILNSNLGDTFTEFAQKSIQYESRGDDDMADIFSSIVELNRHKRIIRYNNNIKFANLRFQFLLSSLVIGVYGVFSMFTDGYVAHFFLNTLGGKIVVLADIVLITLVISYLASIKAKLL